MAINAAVVVLPIRKKKVQLQVHHLESRKTGGNAPDNLITLCTKCHENLHAGTLSQQKMQRLKKHKSKSTRNASHMNIMRPALLKVAANKPSSPCKETHGYVTKATREHFLKLPKSHTNDSLAIALGRERVGVNCTLQH